MQIPEWNFWEVSFNVLFIIGIEALSIMKEKKIKGHKIYRNK